MVRVSPSSEEVRLNRQRCVLRVGDGGIVMAVNPGAGKALFGFPPEVGRGSLQQRCCRLTRADPGACQQRDAGQRALRLPSSAGAHLRPPNLTDPQKALVGQPLSSFITVFRDYRSKHGAEMELLTALCMRSMDVASGADEAWRVGVTLPNAEEV